MPSSPRALLEGGATFAACIVVGLLGALVGTSACGGPSRDAGTPMAGSAAILPSPVKAERVPMGSESAAPSAPSASFAPPVVTLPPPAPPPASASVLKKQ